MEAQAWVFIKVAQQILDAARYDNIWIKLQNRIVSKKIIPLPFLLPVPLQIKSPWHNSTASYTILSNRLKLFMCVSMWLFH